MGKLTISVHRCANLPRADVVSQSCDPYATIEVMTKRQAPTKFKTEAKKKQLNPTFKNAVFVVENTHRDVVIKASVWDADATSGDDLLGCVEFTPHSLVMGTPKKRWYRLIGKASTPEACFVGGIIEISLHSDDFGYVPNAEGATVVEEHELQLVSRLERMYFRYATALLHKAHLHIAQAFGTDVIDTSGPQKLIDGLVAQFGREPGTAQVTVRVVRCSNLPKMDLIGHIDCFVEVRTSMDTKTTEVVKGSANPEFPKGTSAFRLDIADPEQAKVILNVYDNDVTGATLVGSFHVALAALATVASGTPQVRTVPIVRIDGKQQGSLTLELTAHHAISTSVCKEQSQPPPDYSFQRYFDRVFRLLQRFQPTRSVDTDIILSGQLYREEQLMQDLVRQYGCEPGTARVRVAVREVHTLVKKDGMPGAKGDVYVKASMPMFNDKTKTINRTKRAVFEKTFSIDVARPESDVLKLEVFDDDVGLDYCYGTCHLSVRGLRRGAPPVTRTHIVVRNAGTADAAMGAMILVELQSLDDLGPPPPRPLSREEDERNYLRLRAMYLRYDKRRLHELDVVQRTCSDVEAHIGELVALHGAEPGTFKLHVTVLGCKDLPSTQTFDKIDPFVLLSMGLDTFQTKTVKNSTSPTFNQTFTFDVGLPDRDEMRVAVMDEDVDADDEVGHFYMSLRPIITGPEGQERWVPLIEKAGTSQAAAKGLIGLRFQTSDFGRQPGSVPAPPVEQAYRQRVLALLHRFARPRMHEAELLLGRSVGREEQLMQDLVRQYGCEPGTAVVTFRVIGFSDFVTKYSNLYCRVYMDGEKGPSTESRCSLEADPQNIGRFAKQIVDFEDVNAPPKFTAGWELKSELNDVQLTVLRLKVAVAGAAGTAAVGYASISPLLLPKGKTVRRRLRVFSGSSAVDTSDIPDVYMGCVHVEFAGSAIGHSDPTLTEDVADMVQRWYEALVFCKSQPRSNAMSLGLAHQAEMYKRNSEAHQKKQPKPGKEEGGALSALELMHDSLIGESIYAMITIHSCNSLPKMDSFGKCDPYVLFPNGQRTRCIQKTFDATFDESCAVIVRGRLDCPITLKVFDHDVVGSDDLVGSVTLSLKPWLLGCFPAGVPVTAPIMFTPDTGNTNQTKAHGTLTFSVLPAPDILERIAKSDSSGSPGGCSLKTTQDFFEKSMEALSAFCDKYLPALKATLYEDIASSMVCETRMLVAADHKKKKGKVDLTNVCRVMAEYQKELVTTWGPPPVPFPAAPPAASSATSTHVDPLASIL